MQQASLVTAHRLREPFDVANGGLPQQAVSQVVECRDLARSGSVFQGPPVVQFSSMVTARAVQGRTLVEGDKSRISGMLFRLSIEFERLVIVWLREGCVALTDQVLRIARRTS